MKRLFWLVAIVVLVVIGLLYVTQQDSSYFLLVVGNTSIEMNAWLALALLLAVGFSLWLVIAVIALIFRRTRFIGQHFFVRNKEKVQRKMTQGLIAFIEEDWAVAQKKLTRTAKYLPTPAVNYVIAARCAHEMGENTEAMT